MLDRNSTAFDAIGDRSLDGWTVLITGTSSGIGAATAEALATAGASIFLAVRNPSAAREQAVRLTAVARGRIEVVPLDLADLQSVRACAETVANRISVLDCLIANAGISKSPESHLSNGLDVRFATNHLGHFYLAHLLKSQIEAARGRVVVLSSAAHKNRPVQLDDLQWQRRPHQDLVAYGESKAANILFCQEAARRWEGAGVTFNAVLPGSAMTGLQRYHGDDLKRMIGFFDAEGRPNPMLRTVEQAASTVVWAAVADELQGRSGLVLEDCAFAHPAGLQTHPWTGYDAAIGDADVASQLWERSLQILSELGADLPITATTSAAAREHPTAL